MITLLKLNLQYIYLHHGSNYASKRIHNLAREPTITLNMSAVMWGEGGGGGGGGGEGGESQNNCQLYLSFTLQSMSRSLLI